MKISNTFALSLLLVCSVASAAWAQSGSPPMLVAQGYGWQSQNIGSTAATDPASGTGSIPSTGSMIFGQLQNALQQTGALAQTQTQLGTDTSSTGTSQLGSSGLGGPGASSLSGSNGMGYPVGGFGQPSSGLGGGTSGLGFGTPGLGGDLSGTGLGASTFGPPASGIPSSLADGISGYGAYATTGLGGGNSGLGFSSPGLGGGTAGTGFGQAGLGNGTAGFDGGLGGTSQFGGLGSGAPSAPGGLGGTSQFGGLGSGAPSASGGLGGSNGMAGGAPNANGLFNGGAFAANSPAGMVNGATEFGGDQPPAPGAASREKTPMRRALGMLQAGNYDQCLSCLDDVLLTDPTNAHAHYLKAIAYVKTRRYEQAANEYRETLRLNPTPETARLAREGLARLHR